MRLHIDKVTQQIPRGVSCSWPRGSWSTSQWPWWAILLERLHELRRSMLLESLPSTRRPPSWKDMSSTLCRGHSSNSSCQSRFSYDLIWAGSGHPVPGLTLQQFWNAVMPTAQAGRDVATAMSRFPRGDNGKSCAFTQVRSPRSPTLYHPLTNSR